MKVLVTGAAGMLGQDLVSAAEDAGHQVAGFARDELDVTDSAAVHRIVTAEAPDAVVNCAAWTDVDGAEDHPDEALAANGAGAGHVAAAAAACGAKVVYPSSDYVFDGTKAEPYVERDQTNPVSSYGRSKLAGEVETARCNERHFIVRSSWLFGTGGRNFVATMLALADDLDEVVVVKDQIGCPTYTGHLAEGLVRLIEWDAYGIHHIAGGGECSWYDFAVEVFAQAGADCRVMASTSDMLDRKAKRPAYSVLATEREPAIALPDWREGLAAFLAKRAELHA